MQLTLDIVRNPVYSVQQVAYPAQVRGAGRYHSGAIYARVLRIGKVGLLPVVLYGMVPLMGLIARRRMWVRTTQDARHECGSGDVACSSQASLSGLSVVGLGDVGQRFNSAAALTSRSLAVHLPGHIFPASPPYPRCRFTAYRALRWSADVSRGWMHLLSAAVAVCHSSRFARHALSTMPI